MSVLETELVEGASRLGVALDARQQAQLLAYLALLQKWNSVYNLTAVRDPSDMLRLHLLDCLAVVRPFQRSMLALEEQGVAGRVLDVGSGGGLPGIVLAVCCPDLQIDCVDAVAKKMAFVRQAAGQLGLTGLKAIHARVESLQEPYGLIASRAFSSLADFVGCTSHLLAERGCWMAMKGRHPGDEVGQLPDGIRAFHIESVEVPGVAAERCLVWLQKDRK